MYLRFLQVLINAQVDDLYSYNTKYTSPALTQKVFANMRRIGKDFLGVETPLFATMLVQPQAAAEDEDDNEVSAAPTPPSPTQAPSPPPPEPTSPPPHPQPVPPLSPLQEQPTQPTHTSESSMNLLNTLIKTYASLTQKVANLEQDKKKAAQYDLPGIEDMVRNIWSPVKVAYDKHALWGISHWRDQRKTFYGYARGLESTHDVYSTKRILVVTQVGNRLTNLLGDDVFDFAIALQMFTRSMVIQKRVEDLRLGVESY
nr:hypothetical protein [Tanacetum cinerariifolium]